MGGTGKRPIVLLHSSAIYCVSSHLHIVLRHFLNIYTESVQFTLQRWWLQLTEFMFVVLWPFLVAWPTFLPPTLRPSSPCFSLCGLIHLAPSYLLSGHRTALFRENHFTVYHGSDFHAYPYCCTTHWLWHWPSGKQCLCQNPQFLYVKNNMQVLHFTKVSECLISQLLPWLKVRVVVCKTTISLFTDTGS